MTDLSASDLHDLGACGGEWNSCPQCDIEMAQRMKRAAQGAANRREDEDRWL